VGFNERFAKYRSERIRNAVAGLTGKALDPELAIEATPKELSKGAAAGAGGKGKGKGKGKGSGGRSRAKKRPAAVAVDAIDVVDAVDEAATGLGDEEILEIDDGGVETVGAGAGAGGSGVEPSAVGAKGGTKNKRAKRGGEVRGGGNPAK
jgi:hypothetical protein